MRYTAEHKESVREKIILQAARQFRQSGYNGVSIDTVMAKAGLTRGGFYSYFKSKADLFAAVIRSQHEFLDRLKARTAENRKSLVTEGAKIASDYVSKEHRKGVIKGCGIASLAMDTWRSPQASKRAYAGAVRDLIGEFERGLPASEPLDQRAVEAVILSVGALLLANATDADEALADRISTTAQAAIKRSLIGIN